MPANRAPFPKGKRRALWDAAVALLKADPVLKRSVQTWRVLDGRDKDPERSWTLSELPAVALDLSGRPGDWHAIRDVRAPVVLRVELAIDSTAYPDLLDFWEAIESALFPPSHPHGVLVDTLRATIQKQAITSAAVTPKLICDGKGLGATGEIYFDFHRFT